MDFTKWPKDQRDRLDALANQLYDELNPNPDEVINVGKQECIQRAAERMERDGEVERRR